MKNISRKTFLKQSLGLGMVTAMMPFSTDLFASGDFKYSNTPELIQKLIKANDSFTEQLLKPENSVLNRYVRQHGYDFAVLTAAYTYKGSAYFQKKTVLDRMEKLMVFLLSQQKADGTMNAGNLESPPDTAFVMEPLCAAAKILQEQMEPELEKVKASLKEFVVKAGGGLVTGGIHTPNHRWVLSAALAKINHVYPEKRYVDRIDEWLAEGIFIDEDGHYPERSMNYSAVENEAFITMARLLNRDELLKPVRINLQMAYYYMEPNGDLVTFDSRRQDQYSHRSIVSQYLAYRFMAIKDNDSFFAAICKQIEEFEGFEGEIVKGGLYYFMEDPLLQKELPKSEALPLSYEKIFHTSHLARIRRDETTLTVFGGVDWPLIIASGRSISPNFFSYRKGEAILKYMRMSSSFFSMGHFRSEGLKKEGDRFVLYKKQQAPYYQPLPDELRNSDGDYELSPSVDGRFWSKMSFADRPVSNVKTLESKVEIKENQGEVEMEITVDGMEGVAVTIELCFQEGGKLTGTQEASDGFGNHYLEDGFCAYHMGNDKIVFGPGVKEHENIYRLDGEMYTVHFGTLRTEGMHVYLTGITPFKHTVSFK